jgi:acetyl esterase/lipase
MRLVTSSFAWTTLLTVCLAAAPAPQKQTKGGKTGKPRIIPVWPKDAPGSEKWTQKEVEHDSALLQAKVVRNVVHPTLTAFWPERSKANGTAVILCPGGGFHFLCCEAEGTDVAERLRARGVAAFVLKHRLINTGATEAEFHVTLVKAALLKGIADNLIGGERPVLPEYVRKFSALAVADGRQAIKVLREHAGEWGIEPDRIGIMGFSSGGVVSIGVATQDDAASRPNFAASIYGPVLGSVKVPVGAPPLFICCASDDPLVPSRDSIRLYSAWKAAYRSAELHIYAKGSHGLPSDTWIDRFADWLGQQGFLKSDSASRPRLNLSGTHTFSGQADKRSRRTRTQRFGKRAASLFTVSFSQPELTRG